MPSSPPLLWCRSSPWCNARMGVQGVGVMGWGTPQPHGAVGTRQGGGRHPCLASGGGGSPSWGEPRGGGGGGRQGARPGGHRAPSHPRGPCPPQPGVPRPCFFWGGWPCFVSPPEDLGGGESPPCPSFWQLVPPPKPCSLFRCPQAGASWPPLQDPL